VNDVLQAFARHELLPLAFAYGCREGTARQLLHSHTHNAVGASNTFEPESIIHGNEISLARPCLDRTPNAHQHLEHCACSEATPMQSAFFQAALCADAFCSCAFIRTESDTITLCERPSLRSPLSFSLWALCNSLVLEDNLFVLGGGGSAFLAPHLPWGQQKVYIQRMSSYLQAAFHKNI
jgi:hypothetical protein